MKLKENHFYGDSVGCVRKITHRADGDIFYSSDGGRYYESGEAVTNGNFPDDKRFDLTVEYTPDTRDVAKRQFMERLVIAAMQGDYATPINEMNLEALVEYVFSTY